MEKIGRNELKNRILEIIREDYDVLDELKDENGCWIFRLSDGKDELVLTTYLKNVSSAYLSYDANVDRIQIPSIKLVVELSIISLKAPSKEISVLCKVL